jgi:hypothetical protein
MRSVFFAKNPFPARRSSDQPQYFNIPSTFVFQVEKPIISKFFSKGKTDPAEVRNIGLKLGFRLDLGARWVILVRTDSSGRTLPQHHHFH